MDGLSIAANIIAVISAAQLAAQGLQRLYNLRKAPKQVLLLLGEVSDLETVLSLVQETLNQLLLSDQFQDPLFNGHLARKLRNASDVLDEVNGIVESGLIKNLDHISSERVTISWKIWLRRHGYLNTVSSTLSNVKTDLASTLILLTASEVPRLRSTLHKIFLESRGTVHGLQRLEREIAPLSNLESIKSTIEGLQPKGPTEVALLLPIQPESPKPATSALFQRQRRNECSELCLCRCHEQKSFASPRWTESLFGRLFLVYSGKALSENHNCSIISCRQWKSNQLSFRATYFFPFWLLRRVIVVTDRWSPIGHVLYIRTPRMLPDGPRFYAAGKGNIQALQKLFQDGEGSPFDTCESAGDNLLAIAAANKQVETCRFLLQNHADPDQEDSMSRSALDRLTTYLILDPLNPIHIELKHVFSSSLDINESLGKRKFSTLHKLVLGLTSSPIELETYLQLSTSEIEARCSEGKTPLMWAARTNVRAISLLLKYGAKLNDVDNGGNNVFRLTAMLEASSDATESLRLLLQTASELGLLGQMINQPNNTGRRALDLACGNGKTDQVQLLLTHGALTEPESTNPEGLASIFFALDYNCHEIIRLLLAAGAKTDVRDNLKKSVLHIVAQDGDIETIEIMARVIPPVVLETEEKDCFGYTPMVLFEMHEEDFRDRGTEWMRRRRLAFVEFLGDVEKRWLKKYQYGDSRDVEVEEECKVIEVGEEDGDCDGDDDFPLTKSSTGAEYEPESEIFFDAFSELDSLDNQKQT